MKYDGLTIKISAERKLWKKWAEGLEWLLKLERSQGKPIDTQLPELLMRLQYILYELRHVQEDDIDMGDLT